MIVGELDEWTVRLADGHTLLVVAHSFSDEGGSTAFSILVEDKQEERSLLTVFRIPSDVVSEVVGG